MRSTPCHCSHRMGWQSLSQGLQCQTLFWREEWCPSSSWRRKISRPRPLAEIAWRGRAETTPPAAYYVVSSPCKRKHQRSRPGALSNVSVASHSVLPSSGTLQCPESPSYLQHSKYFTLELKQKLQANAAKKMYLIFPIDQLSSNLV